MSAVTDLQYLNTALSEVVVPVGYPAIQRIWNNPSERTPVTGELPAYVIFWNQPAKAELYTFGGSYLATRNYKINFLYKPVGQGTINDNIQDVLQYIEPTLNSLYGHLTLYSTVMLAYPLTYTLPSELPEKWSGQAYVGFSINMTVKEQISLQFGN